MVDLLAVILAAGQGTRMKSKIPKLLHRLAGRAMVDYVVEAARSAGATRVIAIVGHKAEMLREHFAGSGVELVEQEPQLGTGHAVQQVLPILKEWSGKVLILNGDAPLVDAETLEALVRKQEETSAVAAFVTATVNDPQ